MLLKEGKTRVGCKERDGIRSSGRPSGGVPRGAVADLGQVRGPCLGASWCINATLGPVWVYVYDGFVVDGCGLVGCSSSCN